MNYISPEIGTVRYICNDCINSNIYSNIWDNFNHYPSEWYKIKKCK